MLTYVSTYVEGTYVALGRLYASVSLPLYWTRRDQRFLMETFGTTRPSQSTISVKLEYIFLGETLQWRANRKNIHRLSEVWDIRPTAICAVSQNQKNGTTLHFSCTKYTFNDFVSSNPYTLMCKCPSQHFYAREVIYSFPFVTSSQILRSMNRNFICSPCNVIWECRK